MNHFYFFGCFKDKEDRKGWDIVKLPNGEYQWIVRRGV